MDLKLEMELQEVEQEIQRNNDIIAQLEAEDPEKNKEVIRLRREILDIVEKRRDLFIRLWERSNYHFNFSNELSAIILNSILRELNWK